MRAVLGIDAAWTLNKPSGVALVAERSGGWSLIELAPSYGAFHAAAGRECEPGSLPNAADLLSSASLICGGRVDLVAVDMPLAHTPIIGRRTSDNAVSMAYGKYQCGTHTPSAQRPGSISEDLKRSFALAGYALLTIATKPMPRGVIEVYPHPALVELANSPIRLPYKVSKVSKYWPDLTPSERYACLWQQWIEIIRLLGREIQGIEDKLPAPQEGVRHRELKSYEDMLDAIVCAWVAICVLEGRAKPHGDGNSAIWIPQHPYHPRVDAVARSGESAWTGLSV